MKKFAKITTIIMIVAIVLAMAIGLTACDNRDKLSFYAPDGTPALAMLRLASQHRKLGGHNIEYTVEQPELINAQMAGKADIIIMPINVGAKQIVDPQIAYDYKLISVAVEGSLYLVGHKDEVSGSVPPITMNDIKGKRIACIGKQGVPGLVFRFVMEANNIEIVESGQPTQADYVYVEYVSDGSKAVARYTATTGEKADYIVVGEPAATAQKLNNKNDINAEMDMQAEYAKACDIQGEYNYPQAGLFVRTMLCEDAEFMKDLFEALEDNKEWIALHEDEITAEARSINSTSTFPAKSIRRCNIDCDRIDSADADEIIEFLKNIMPSVNWAESKDVLFWV